MLVVVTCLLLRLYIAMRDGHIIYKTNTKSMCNNVMTVIDKYPTMIHNMLVLISCTRCNRLC